MKINRNILIGVAIGSIATIIITCYKGGENENKEDNIVHQISLNTPPSSPVDSIVWDNSFLNYQNIKNGSIVLPKSFFEITSSEKRRAIYNIYEFLLECMEECTEKNCYHKLDNTIVDILYESKVLNGEDIRTKRKDIEFKRGKEEIKAINDFYLTEKPNFSNKYRTYLIFRKRKNKPHVNSVLYILNIKSQCIISMVEIAKVISSRETFVEMDTRTNQKLFYTTALYGVYSNLYEPNEKLSSLKNTVFASLFQFDENGYVQLVEKK